MDSHTQRAGRDWAGWLGWLGRHELGVLIALVLVAAGLWGFVELADEVIEGETRAVDERILLALRTPEHPDDPLGPVWFEQVMRDFSALGGLAVLTSLTLVVCGYLLLQGKWRTTLLVLAAVFGGILLNITLKHLFGRPRPDLVAPLVQVGTHSFPSGHSLVSSATYLTLAALLMRVSAQRRVKAYLLLVALLLVLLIGASRVYLGVHWPTDVVAGWTVGATWAVLCWVVAFLLQRRQAIEPPGTGPRPPALPPRKPSPR